MKKILRLLFSALFASVAVAFIGDMFTFKDPVNDLLKVLLSLGFAYFGYIKATNKSIQIPFLKKPIEPMKFQLASYEYYQSSLKAMHEDFGNIQNAEVFEDISLRPEPTNKHDKDAIAVYYKDSQIGYVPASLTHEVRENINGKCILRVYNYNDYTRAELLIK